jgi:hypothetical protein
MNERIIQLDHLTSIRVRVKGATNSGVAPRQPTVVPLPQVPTRCQPVPESSPNEGPSLRLLR